MNEDPFAPKFDPDLKRFQKDQHHALTRSNQNHPEPCHCRAPTALSRRTFISAAGSLSLLPIVATADSFIPCIQDTQRIKRCHHRFCKHYGGGREYHGRI